MRALNHKVGHEPQRIGARSGLQAVETLGRASCKLPGDIEGILNRAMLLQPREQLLAAGGFAAEKYEFVFAVRSRQTAATHE